MNFYKSIKVPGWVKKPTQQSQVQTLLSGIPQRISAFAQKNPYTAAFITAILSGGSLYSGYRGSQWAYNWFKKPKNTALSPESPGSQPQTAIKPEPKLTPQPDMQPATPELLTPPAIPEQPVPAVIPPASPAEQTPHIAVPERKEEERHGQAVTQELEELPNIKSELEEIRLKIVQNQQILNQKFAYIQEKIAKYQTSAQASAGLQRNTKPQSITENIMKLHDIMNGEPLNNFQAVKRTLDDATTSVLKAMQTFNFASITSQAQLDQEIAEINRLISNYERAVSKVFALEQQYGRSPTGQEIKS